MTRKVNAMRWYLASIATFAWLRLVVGCNTVSPDDCWPNTSGGLGGGGPIPIGAGVGATSGDFLTPPQPGPLNSSDTSNPCVASKNDGDPQGGTDCDNKCFSEYDAAMNACAKVANGVDRTSCQGSAFAEFEQCRAGCTDDSVEQCKKLCDKINLDCIARCPKGDKNCMNQCNQQNGKYLKDCEK